MRPFFIGFFIMILGLVAYNVYTSLPERSKMIQVAQNKLSSSFNFIPAKEERKLSSLAFNQYIKEKDTISLKPISLASQKPIILHFWEIWCNVCTNEMPQFYQFFKKHKDVFHIIPISNDRGMGKNVMGFLEEHKITDIPAYHDTDGSLARLFKVNAFPTTVILSHDGKEIGRIIGAFEWRKEGERNLLNLLENIH